MQEQGIKPVILTNAMALTPELLHELKKAGLAGFTMHIDSHQNRPHWKEKTEKDHNELRQKYRRYGGGRRRAVPGVQFDGLSVNLP